MAGVMHSPDTPNDRTANSGRRAKAAGAFRTISEVADELDVAQHVLRFWESKFPQVRPLKRGGGRRYYRPEDVDLLRRIRSLLYDEGYTIKGAQKLLKGQRRSPTDRPTHENGSSRAAGLESQTNAASTPPPAPLDAQQKQVLRAIRTELTQLRDNLRKFST
ncbi:MAG: MerR family transcriptional regulator [Alphaproteobacteria bacterium]|nr:MerR family transcriptional regulator [Alphaproteobacteria bacterium]